MASEAPTGEEGDYWKAIADKLDARARTWYGWKDRREREADARGAMRELEAMRAEQRAGGARRGIVRIREAASEAEEARRRNRRRMRARDVDDGGGSGGGEGRGSEIGDLVGTDE